MASHISSFLPKPCSVLAMQDLIYLLAQLTEATAAECPQRSSPHPSCSRSRLRPSRRTQLTPAPWHRPSSPHLVTALHAQLTQISLCSVSSETARTQPMTR
jgi:hypothetical protein